MTDVPTFEDPPQDFPEQITQTLVYGRYTSTSGDGPDAGTRPDMVPLFGCDVLFEPSRNKLSYRAFNSADEDYDLALLPFHATTDVGGYVCTLHDPTVKGVSVLASIGNAFRETGWTWTVTVTPPKHLNIKPWISRFAAPGGGSVNLNTLETLPVTPEEMALPQWKAVVLEAINARDAAISAANRAQQYAEILGSVVGEGSGTNLGALLTHIQNERPHVAAESETDFSNYFTNGASNGGN